MMSSLNAWGLLREKGGHAVCGGGGGEHFRKSRYELLIVVGASVTGRG